MNPVKKYQNVSYDELISYANHNPNRSRCLETIEIPKVVAQDTTLDNLGLTGFTVCNLSGILSVFACIADPDYYAMASKQMRTQLNIDLSTALQQETDSLKNTSIARKRKKLYELIGAAYNNSAFQEKDYFDLFHGLSIMRNVQFVLMKEAVQENIEDDKKVVSALKGDILFSSDPSTWKSEYPVWLADYRGRWVAIPSHAAPLSKILATWLSTIEQQGWMIQWPEVEGTKKEIVEQLSVLPTWEEADKKLLRETLAVRLGKANTLRVFTRWL